MKRSWLAFAFVLGWTATWAAGKGKPVNENQDLTAAFSPALVEYLTASDGLGAAAAEERHPGIRAQAESPEVRRQLMTYLQSKAALKPENTDFTLGALRVVQTRATANEAATFASLEKHPEPLVRLAAYESEYAGYFAQKESKAMRRLAERMLRDPDERIQTRGRDYLQ